MNEQAHNPLDPSIPRDGRQQGWTGLPGSAPALALSRLLERRPGVILAVTATSQEAYRLESELRFYTGAETPLLPFPDWETLPYDVFSPHQDIVSQRLATLYSLPRTQHGILIVPVPTLMQRLPPPQFLDAEGLVIQSGDTLQLETMRQRLEQAGYRNVPEVMEHGEFAVRGAVLDLFPMGSRVPYRIDLFDDEVDTIRTFDPETQLTVDRVDAVRLLPGREFPVDEDAITRFRKGFRAAFAGDPTRSRIYCDVSDGVMPNGIEYYLPLFFEETATLFDYLPAASLVFQESGVDTGIDGYWQEIAERYEQRGHDPDRPLLPPDSLFLDPDSLRDALSTRTAVRLETETEAEQQRGPAPGRVRYAARALPGLTLHARSDEPERLPLAQFLADFEGRCLFVAETAGHREALTETLAREGIHPRTFEHWQTFLDDDSRFGITVAALDHGLVLDDPPLAVIPEPVLLGDRAQQRRGRRQQKR
ncbi:MAG: transcription-repair coupling factor, partial [Ectothiorhodospiraceae bacterium]